MTVESNMSVSAADTLYEREFSRRLALAFSPFVNELGGCLLSSAEH